MDPLQNIRLFFYRNELKKRLKQQARKKSPKRVNLENAKVIGILFDATDLKTRDTVLAYAKELKNQNKKICLLGFFDNKVDSENYTFEAFNRKNIDWAFRPKGENVETFINNELDILIHVDTQSNLQAQYICALSNAKLKVGPVSEHIFCYDLMIDASKIKQLKHFIQQIEFFLKKTNIRHEPAAI
ncbi:MAG: hypothetical protein DHS20C18_55770 [Saprospiraceae bacterium]|nr:MAG: hypothetical protein DHS20C18_55770 [Saprospiraceae bacterium]